MIEGRKRGERKREKGKEEEEEAEEEERKSERERYGPTLRALNFERSAQTSNLRSNYHTISNPKRRIVCHRYRLLLLFQRQLLSPPPTQRRLSSAGVG